MNAEFRLPDLGEGLAEAEIVQWMVSVGDTVTLNQTLAEVETAKAVVELPSPHAGTVTLLHAEAGETVAVGAPLIEFAIDGVDTPEPHSAERAAPPRSEPNLVGYGAAPDSGAVPKRRGRRVPSASSPESAVLEAAPHDVLLPTTPVPPLGERPRSTPPVRAYAKRLGIDLAVVAAVVGERVITRGDIDDFAASGRESVAVGSPAPGQRRTVPVDAARETRVPIRGVRKHTADAMVASAFTAPHVTTFHTVDVTRTMELIADLRADRSLNEHRIGVLAVVAKVVCDALARHSQMNARWEAQAGEIVQFHYVNLGIAAATDRGLVVPVVRDADAMTLPELADALSALATTARTGKTAPADLAGGTFSLTNIGVFGIDAGTPILPPGQTGILAMGAVRKMPWEHRGEIALRDVMTLSLSFDHRVVDGADGARFLKDVAEVLENPARALLR